MIGDAFRTRVLILGLLLALTLLISLWGVDGIFPARKEGFDEIAESTSLPESPIMPGGGEAIPHMEQLKKATEIMKQLLPSVQEGAMAAAASAAPEKKEGFDNNHGSPVNFTPYGSFVNQGYKPELYSTFKGGCNDNPTSSYSNSNGYLCLSDEGLRMLQTRGGNQTGVSS